MSDVIADLMRDRLRQTEARCLDAAIGLANEYGERGVPAPRMVLVTFVHEPMRLVDLRLDET